MTTACYLPTLKNEQQKRRPKASFIFITELD